MNQEFYKRLVDLYAGRELPDTLETELEWAAMGDPDLNHDMTTLRRTVDLMQSDTIEMTEESFQRVLQKVYLRSGSDVAGNAPEPAHLQFHLPIQG
jgi:hypothetical protein